MLCLKDAQLTFVFVDSISGVISGSRRRRPYRLVQGGDQQMQLVWRSKST